MNKHRYYNAHIEWDGEETPIYDNENPVSFVICGRIKTPDGVIHGIRRIGRYETPITHRFAGVHYLLDTHSPPSRFETMDDLFQKGLGLTKESEEVVQLQREIEENTSLLSNAVDMLLQNGLTPEQIRREVEEAIIICHRE